MSTDSPDYFDSFSGVFGESESSIVSSSPAGTSSDAPEEAPVISGTRNWYDKPFSVSGAPSTKSEAPALGQITPERALGTEKSARQQDFTRALGAKMPSGQSMPDTRFASLGDAAEEVPTPSTSSTGKDLLKVMGAVCLGLWALNELGVFDARGKQ